MNQSTELERCSFESLQRSGREETCMTIGRCFQKKLDTPIATSAFRLNIRDASEGPTIADI
jgi:hypothetical protein